MHRPHGLSKIAQVFMNALTARMDLGRPLTREQLEEKISKRQVKAVRIRTSMHKRNGARECARRVEQMRKGMLNHQNGVFTFPDGAEV